MNETWRVIINLKLSSCLPKHPLSVLPEKCIIEEKLIKKWHGSPLHISKI
jgi:hypothetical protein